MEATALIEEIRKLDGNTFAVTMSVGISSFHLRIMKKNDKETMHEMKERYSFVLTDLLHKFHMAPNGALGECMEVRDTHDSCRGLTPYQQRQWCVGELTHRVVNRVITAELTKHIFLVDIPMTDEGTMPPIEVDGENVSPYEAVRERLRELETGIESLVNLLDGMRAVSDIEEDISEEIFKEFRKRIIDETARCITLD